MNREIVARLRRAGPWICAGAVLLLVAVSPWLFRGGTGDAWLWRWIGFSVLVLGIVVAYAALVSDSERTDAGPTTDQDRPARAGERSASPDTGDTGSRPGVPSTAAATPEEDTGPETPESSDEAAEPLTRIAPDTAPEPTHEPLPSDATPTPGHLVAAAAASESDLVERYKREAESTQVALLSLGRKVQASAHRIQQEAARAVSRHASDPDVLETGLRLDHAAAQQARLAQSLATLCGMQPGQQWYDPMPVADVIWAAAGRITAYKRVKIEGDPALAVTGTVVEPLIHLIAELLANATQSSPPGTDVIVTLREVRRGASIEVDDSGVSMDEASLRRAREIASGRQQVTLADLGEIPQTGLAVVGTYARRHGFRVDLTESVHGGIRAAVIVPKALTVSAPKETFPFGGRPEPERKEKPVSARHGGSAPTEPAAPAPVPEPIPAPIPEAIPEPASVDTPAAEAPTAPRPVVEPAAEPTTEPAAEPTPTPETTAEPAAKTGEEPSAEPAKDSTAEGLPKRRSRRASARPEPPPRQEPTPPSTHRPTAEQAGAWMGGYLAATRRTTKRDTDPPRSSRPTTGDDNDER